MIDPTLLAALMAGPSDVPNPALGKEAQILAAAKAFEESKDLTRPEDIARLQDVATPGPLVNTDPSRMYAVTQALTSPEALRTINMFGAALAGEDSFAARLASVNNQMIDSQQTADYITQAMAGENIGDIEQTRDVRGISAPAREQALTALERERAAEDRAETVDQGGARVEQGDRSLDLQAARDAATNLHTERGLDLEETGLRLRETLAIMGFEQDEINREHDRWLQGRREAMAAADRAAQERANRERLAQSERESRRSSADRAADRETVSGATGPIDGTQLRQIESQLVTEYREHLPAGTEQSLINMATGSIDVDRLISSLPPQQRASAMARRVELESVARAGGNVYQGATPRIGVNGVTYENLPPGAIFEDPQGNLRQKPQ